MEPVDVYLMYCALKAHFNSDYDFFKYGGKTKISRDSFFKRKDRHFFVKISKKYREYAFIRDYFVSNFIKHRAGYIANFSDENYKEWLAKKINFYMIFIDELKPVVKDFDRIDFEPLFEIENNNHPKLLKEYLGGRISLETIVILDDLVDFSNKWDKQLKDDIIWPDLKKLIKNYKGFLTINKNKYRIELLKLIEESK